MLKGDASNTKSNDLSWIEQDIANSRPTLWVVRHGETALNAPPERIRGWSNPPLTGKGEREGRAVGKELAALGRRPKAIFASNLNRATKTAELVRAQFDGLGIPIYPTVALRPWDVGKYTGQPVKEIHHELAEAVREKTKLIPGGEPFIEFLGRAIDGWLKILAFAERASSPIIAVTHTRNVRLLLALAADGVSGVLEGPPSLYLSKAEDPLPPGDFIELKFDGATWREDASGGIDHKQSDG